MSNRDKIITIRQNCLIILMLCSYAFYMKDVLSMLIGTIFTLATIFAIYKLDRDGKIRDDLKIIDYFSFKHYIKE